MGGGGGILQQVPIVGGLFGGGIQPNFPKIPEPVDEEEEERRKRLRADRAKLKAAGAQGFSDSVRAGPLGKVASPTGTTTLGGK